MAVPVGRGEECPACGVDVRCCMNCTSYDAQAPNQCREPMAEWIADREKANFCEWFTLGRRSGERYGAAAEESKKRLEALFGPKK